MKFEIPKESISEDDEKIIGEVRKYNSQFLPAGLAPLSVYCRDDNGGVIGGLTGKTYWSYLDIQYLWVDESLRGKGAGARIMAMAENEAKTRGCSISMLDTYEFQALGFYLKQGYIQFGRLENYGGRYERYFLVKNL